MYEYINYGGLIFLLFILLIIFLMDRTKKQKKSSWGFFYIMLMLLIGLLLFDANHKATTATDNMYSFSNRNLSLKCMVGGGLYSASNKYRVSKSDGWYLEKGYFIKDSLIIDASRCERW